MPNNFSIGTVLRLSRRRVQVQLAERLLEFQIPRKFSNLVAGDLVQITEGEITGYEERGNLIKRSILHRSKEVVANLDHLLIVTAPPPLFNPSVIDRLITISIIENIPISIVINKIDLSYDTINQEILYYQGLGIPIYFTSAISGLGIDKLTTLVHSSKLSRFAFSGVSGVGKSSLLKKLLVIDDIRTSEVSHRTGQGRQTTSEVQGYLIPNASSIIFDVPGIQNFGLSHLTAQEVRLSFSDFNKFPCPYSDCQHLGESDCAVKVATQAGDILPSRYQSYLQIISEISRNRSY